MAAGRLSLHIWLYSGSLLSMLRTRFQLTSVTTRSLAQSLHHCRRFLLWDHTQPYMPEILSLLAFALTGGL
jgi:hypothetical protein